MDQRDLGRPIAAPLLMTAISAVRKNQPLPPNPFREDLDASFHAAYDKCLRHEEAA
jgi:hypothetical protein